MWELRNQGCAQSFACIHQRVDEHSFLKDRESFQSAPWIVSATEKNHGSNYHAEHQANMLLIDAAPQSQSAACGEGGYQYNDPSEGPRRPDTDFNSGPKHQPYQRNHDQPGSQRLQHSGDDFLDGDPGNADRGEQAVFDFARPLKLSDERHGHSPNSGEDHADRDDAGEQKAIVRGRQITTADQQPA